MVYRYKQARWHFVIIPKETINSTINKAHRSFYILLVIHLGKFIFSQIRDGVLESVVFM